MAVRKETFKKQMDEALGSILEPGERELVSVNTIVGISPWLAAGIIGLIGQFFVKYYYITVTDRRVLFIQVSRLSGRPKGLAFTDPRPGPTVSESKPAAVWSSFKYTRPDGKSMKVHVHRFWRDEMAATIQALIPPIPPVGQAGPAPGTA